MLNFLILAKNSASNAPTLPSDKSLSMSVGLILIGIIIGLAITLMPPKRTSEVKKPEKH